MPPQMQLPYKVFTGVINQNGINNPSVTILQNTLGVALTWTRQSAGIYLANGIGAFNGTCWAHGEVSGDADIAIGLERQTNDTFLLASNRFYNGTNNQEDGLLQNACFEIRVYP